MNISQFFVSKRPIAWTAMISVLAWGVYAYVKMPQRQDPIIPVVTGVILTPYPGAEAEKVEQEVTRKIERKVAENPAVEHVKSISRPGISIVYVELFEAERNAELVWQDIRGKLGEIPDLPQAAGKPTQSFLNKDFGDSVAVMLTISSPPVTDLEIGLRAASIREALQAHRRQIPAAPSDERWSGVLVYPSLVSRAHVLRMGRVLAQRLIESGIAREAVIVEAPSAGMLDVTLVAGKTRDDLQAATDSWEHETAGASDYQPDVWRPFWIQDLDGLERELRRNARDKYTYRELKHFADRIRDRLKQSPYVAQIDLVGVQDERVWLSYSGERLNQFGITPLSLVDQIRRRNINVPGGQVELSEQNVVVRPTGEFTSAAEIGQTVLDLSDEGYPLYLRDLVEVTRGYEDPAGVLNFRTVKLAPGHSSGEGQSAAEGASQGEHELPAEYELQTGRAITISVRQVKGTHISDYDRDITAAVEEMKLQLPQDLRLERTSNEPAEVEHKISSFIHCLIEAIVIVVLVSMVFMEWRSALLVAVCIPITVAMTLGMAQLVGIDLQQVSIAALIIALGMLVDAPVVAADAINRELAHGQPRAVAAWRGPTRLARAVFYATLTNIVAFLPLLLVKGKTGDFIYSLPIVVSLSLVAAMLVAWTFAPLMGFYLLKGQKGFEASDGKPITGFPRLYKAFVEHCIAHRFVSVGIAVLILSAGALLVGSIGSSFFPKDLHDVFVVNLDLPEGSPIRQTREVALDAIRQIDALEGRRVRSYTTFVGAGGPRFWLSIEPEQRAENYAQILVHTTDKHETASVVDRLKQELPARISDARVRTQMLETGPPIGIPVQLRIYGADTDTLRELASQVKTRLRSIPGIIDVHDDWGDPVFQMTLKIDSDRSAMSGLTHQDVASAVGTGLSGLSVSSLRERDRLIDIVLRLRPSERSHLDDLYSLNVVNAATGVGMPLRQLAAFEQELVTPKIRRRDHERCITVRCDTVPGVLPSAIVAELERALPAAPSAGGSDANAIAFPSGYRWEFGGEKFEQDKGFESLTTALVVSFVAIYLALVLQFNSATQPILIYAAVPFGVVGGLIGLLIFGSTFGFMAFLGVASLAGLIISHVIVLFDFIDEMRHKGEPLRKAVVDAGLARLRPVVVTVLACVGGLIPLALSGGPLWEPMCYVQIVGMLVATLVTLVVVPVLYVIFVEDLRLVRWETEPNPQQEHGSGMSVVVPAAAALPSDSTSDLAQLASRVIPGRSGGVAGAGDP
ncbi:MAG TPA: efflux RND transporter permease subunit [Planctomycetota bacterium]|nr:efflux RND transporter permease subunit [Planctomycetota bacterium]